MSQKTWGGRFSGDTDRRVEAFTESIHLDRRLYRHDIRASQAHARMLAEVGLLTADEARQITEALDAIAAEIDRGTFAFSVALEDIHTHIERALIERLGDVGRKLHTARSRNDQVVTDVKLWVRDAIDGLDDRLHELQAALLEAGLQNRNLILPGYTHLQRAQPVLAAHYFLAHVEKYQRDRERLADCRRRVNVLPLGAAALAGTSLPIDRDSVRRQLGFDALAANSLDVSSDRDFLLEFVFDLSVIALHLAGWAEEWVLWATTEFGFLDLPDAFCTGSSIMPHKKNPDVLELIRGKAARVTADLQQLLTLVKGLPFAYNRDLQEDKHALFDAHDTVAASLELAAPLVRQTRFRAEVIAARLEDGFLDATTLMEFFITHGVPMRAAHEAVGKLVRLCEERRCRLADLPPAAYEEVRPGLADGVYKVLGVANALAAFRSAGSTAPAEVDRQLALWSERLARGDGSSSPLPSGERGERPPPSRLVHAARRQGFRYMDHFSYRDRILYCEDVPVRRLAETYGTPLYVYSKATLLHHLKELQTAFAPVAPLICYSIKTNGNLTLCRLMHGAGAGFDVTSGGELYRALKAGGRGEQIVFAGVGKTDAELREALGHDVFLFNVESEEELHNLAEVARGVGKVARAALRVNPDLPPKTHHKTDTSVKGVKFGLDIDTVLDVARGVVGNPHVRVVGLHMHLGSPILSTQPYRDGAAKGLVLIDRLREQGHPIEVLNMGGGFGIHYRKQEAQPARAFAEVIVPAVQQARCRLVLEPGRFIVGNAGILVSRVLYRKESGGKHFLIQDAAMNDLIRPTLYDSFHRIWPVEPAADVPAPPQDYEADIPGTLKQDVVGPVCESGDFLAKDRRLPPLGRGDLLATFSAGAYGMAMASNYNSRPRAAEVLVDGAAHRLIRRRETYEDLVRPELEL